MLLDNKPTVLSVSSPYQILCAIEALKYYHIEEYYFVITTHHDSRDEQIRNTLNFFKINDYEWNYTTKKTYWLEYLKVLFCHRSRRYCQMIIGSAGNPWTKLAGLAKCKPHSTVLYVDDGNSTMTFLSGLSENEKPSIKSPHKKIYNFAIGFDEKNQFFTIYKDIAKPIYHCDLNQFVHLQSYNHEKKRSKFVYILGTNSIVYCDKLGLQQDEFDSSLRKLIEDLAGKYGNNNIIYVPHGRDLNTNHHGLCEHHGIKYLIPSVSVEMMLLEAETYPLAIYGYTSTALLNIKRIFPSADIFNVICYRNHNTKYTGEYEFISSYFEKHGISVVEQK